MNKEKKTKASIDNIYTLMVKCHLVMPCHLDYSIF